MVGYPKYLNTKDDYEFVRKNFPKDMWQPTFESLLDTRRDWFNEGEITGTGITDETHKVIIDEQSGEKYQYVYKENPNCRMEQLGYTEDEIKSILG